MDKTKTKWYIKPLVEYVRDYGISSCEKKAKEIYGFLHILSNIKVELPVLNVGGGNRTHWPTAKMVDAMYEPEMDFNTKSLPFDSESYPVVVCEQVIEHLHNTTWFLSELHRVLKTGGSLLISTENLVSLPNLFAMALQRAPFSTQALCGQFLGGWKSGPTGYEDGVKLNHPTYAGVHGHVRVMTVGQLKGLFELMGFRVISKHGFGGNHYVLFHLIKK